MIQEIVKTPSIVDFAFNARMSIILLLLLLYIVSFFFNPIIILKENTILKDIRVKKKRRIEKQYNTYVHSKTRMRLIDLLNNKPCCVRFTMITKQRYDCVQSITRFIQFLLLCGINFIQTQFVHKNITHKKLNILHTFHLKIIIYYFAYKILISIFFFFFESNLI